ncbi:hypothetical protein GUJ93_ZPchr0004g40078 [Zizania palustris]|uniref:Uncharacterized protein n=1 Tax=Zizania palustris TaxID=103762 RepID=A0A8J5SEN6_ZIZPA|nr:hypothetical protein GUJ93_ZPchr0004g40078 [Zizania palustris]
MEGARRGDGLIVSKGAATCEGASVDLTEGAATVDSGNPFHRIKLEAVGWNPIVQNLLGRNQVSRRSSTIESQ